MSTRISTRKVKRSKEADGARCLQCDAVFSVLNEGPYWGWRKSKGLHETSGHKLELFAIV